MFMLAERPVLAPLLALGSVFVSLPTEIGKPAYEARLDLG